MGWVSFPDKEAFIAYHDQVCADLGIPCPGRNQKTGELALDAQWTVAWVRPIDDNGVLKTPVPDEDVVTYKLTETDPPAPTPEDEAEAPTSVKPSWDAEIDRALPPTWEGKPVPPRKDQSATVELAGATHDAATGEAI